MPVNDRERDMHALRNLIDEAHAVVSTSNLAEGRSKRATSLLESALALVDDFIAQPPEATALGQRGGLKTAEKGPDYFRELASKRKIKSGGRAKTP